nr:MAG: DUF3883 domain-containing protein [Leptolyngbya sp. IPPAS B-1204]
MAQLEDLTRGTTVKGILPTHNVTVIDAKWHGSDVVELTYKDANGQPHTEILFRDREPTLEIVTEGRPWSFDGDGALLRLVSEAHRIRLAHLFDPLLAVHTSLVEPLPHQITAVYSEMLTRQPLRFLLADDPGAGKTIMAGLFIRELLIRGDLQRCMIVCPGSLAVQWQDELFQKFHLPFEILTNGRIEAARTGNAFAEMPLVIVRLDKLSRNEDLQAKLGQTSSPEAIYQSLRRRRERLQKRLREEELLKRGLSAEIDFGPTIDPDDWDDDFEDSSSDEREAREEEVVDQATAARTIAELQAEIHQLGELENLALRVRRSDKDRKWDELSKLLQNSAEMFDAGGHRRKLVIFTEHRDTLNYLVNQITTLIGRPEAVVTIHGGMGREERKKAEEAFKQDVTVQVLIATDAAGEGINLQRAHLMVNYDLPVKAKLDQVVADRLDQSRLREPGTGQLRFIEVKGRIEGAETVTVTKNEILAALNKPDNFILALVQVPADQNFPEGDAFKVKTTSGTYAVSGAGCKVRYVQQPFQREPDFGASSVNYTWKELWNRGREPK